jgi:hypothetical protein
MEGEKTVRREKMAKAGPTYSIGWSEHHHTPATDFT